MLTYISIIKYNKILIKDHNVNICTFVYTKIINIMSYEKLCKYVTTGEYNYHSIPFDIFIEPLKSLIGVDVVSYRVIVQNNKKQVVEVVDVEPKFKGWKDADELRDTLLLTKQKLHAKFIGC